MRPDGETSAVGSRASVRFARTLLLTGLLLGLTMGMIGQAQSFNPLPSEAKRLAMRTEEQLGVAIREAVFAWPASELEELRPRAARMVNVIVGQDSRHYQSEAGDPPGSDGVGVLVHLDRLRSVIRSNADGTNRARTLLFALEIATTFARDAQGELLQALRARGASDMRAAVRRALAFLSAARGAREDPLSEGGVRALLVHLGTLT